MKATSHSMTNIGVDIQRFSEAFRKRIYEYTHFGFQNQDGGLSLLRS